MITIPDTGLFSVNENLVPYKCCMFCQDGEMYAEHNGYILRSVFQPIYSLSHHRQVGCEALVRISDKSGASIPPPLLFNSIEHLPDLIFLDRLCRMLHAKNFSMKNSDNWLFLNIDPVVAVNGRSSGGFFRPLLDCLGIPAHQVVVEITESAIKCESDLEAAAAYYREQGCLLAIDDFGAGSSNFERIWRLEPEIVKLDRKMIVQSIHSGKYHRILPGLVGLLHESGSMVLAEGIETREEAMIVLDAGVDLVQGYFFSHPFSITADFSSDMPSLSAMQNRFITSSLGKSRRAQQELAPYLKAFDLAARMIQGGWEVEDAVQKLLSLELAMRFYILNSQGMQTSHNINSGLLGIDPDPRLLPLSNAKGACWSHRPYFRKAINHPDDIQVTRPYLSLPDLQMCLTLSVSIELNGEYCVLCLDIAVKCSTPAYRKVDEQHAIAAMPLSRESN